MQTVPFQSGEARTMTQNTADTSTLFLSCDWGTTSFRLKLVDSDNGQIVSSFSDSDGIKVIYSRWAEQEGKKRLDFFISVLSQKIDLLESKSKTSLNSIPIVLSGMSSSSIGLKELPYKKLPLKLGNPELKIDTIRSRNHFMHDLYLVSGVCSSEDVMRGEETQLLGLAAMTGIGNGCYIIPGTHSKHLFVENNVLIDFRTYLTGELFDLLSTHSILAGSVARKNRNNIGEFFYRGIETSLKENILNSLFKIRSRSLLTGIAASDNYDFLSGLLIGLELSDLQHSNNSRDIVVAGDERIQTYYSEALEYLKLDHIEADSGTDATVLAHRIILENCK
jgi:2-dehydro-3-deoxygalactonokinase